MTKMENLLEVKVELDSISEKIQDLKCDIDKISTSIAEQRFIPIDISFKVMDKLKEIARLNEKCQQLYPEIMLYIEMSDVITHAKKLVDNAISEEEINMKIANYRRFLCITTKDEEVLKILMEKRVELEALLENYSNEIEEKLEPFAKFLDALAETNASKLVSYIIELTPIFGTDLVAKAFLEKQLVFEKLVEEVLEQEENQIDVIDVCEEEAKEIGIDVSKEEIEEIDIDTTREEIEEVDIDITREKIKEVSIDISKEQTVIESCGTSDITLISGTEEFLENKDLEKVKIEKIQTPETEKIKEDLENSITEGSIIEEVKNYYNELLEKEMLITKEVFSKDFSSDISSAEKKNFSAKAFMNEMTAKNMFANMITLTTMTDYNCISKELLMTISQLKEEKAELALEYLTSKGYLRKYSVEEIGTFYCISPRAEKAFQTKASRKFLKLKGNFKLSSGEPIEDSIQAVLTRITYTKLLQKYFETFPNENWHIGDIVSTEYFFVEMSYMEVNLAFVGAYWFHSKEEEIKEFMECMANKDASNWKNLVVAGLNFEIAKKQADMLLSVLEVDTDIVYYYSLLENSFKRYEDDEEYTIEDIFEDFEFDEIDFFENEDELEEDDEFEIFNSNDKRGKIDELAILDSSNKRKKIDELIRLNSGNQIKNNNTIHIQKKHNETEERVDFIEEENTQLEQDEEETIISEEFITELEPIVEEIDLDIEKIYSNVYQMIVSNKTYCAIAYLRSMMDKKIELKNMYEKLAYAVNEPWLRCSYNSQTIFTTYADAEHVFSEYLFVSATMRNFFMNHVSYDYDMRALYANIKELDVVIASANLTDAIYRLISFKEEVHKGINFYADYKIKDKEILERDIKKLEMEAKSYYDLYVLGHIKEKTSHRRYVKTRELIFSQKEDLAKYLKIVVEKELEKVENLSHYLKEVFMKEDTTIDISNLDYEKLNDFIDEYWERAAETMNSVRRTSDLMSELRNNLSITLQKILKVMCDWVILVEESHNLKADKGRNLYKEIKKKLIDNMKGAKAELEKKRSNIQLAELAGIIILENTLTELISRIDGSFDEKAYKYFYIDFLRGKSVLLDENYLPDLKGNAKDFKELTLTNRIFIHSKETLMTFEEKLNDIFYNYGDDYGTAELIISYLEDMEEKSFDYNYDVKSSEELAEKDAGNKFNEFIENLELAQSYGQIEESKENKKEKIQKVASEWFEYAKLSKNYGFFHRVLEMYRAKIQKDAKVRGVALLKELEQIKEKETLDDSMQLKIKKIKEMIEKQNYTVAEDLLSRIYFDESDEEIEVSGTDYLKKFIDEYDVTYKNVVGSGKKLSTILASKMRNKDERGAGKLINNWMGNGQALPEAKLNQLLDALGFFGASAKMQSKIDTITNYLVTIKDNSEGRKVNYKHPISAFGSKAREEGFRVICLFGVYDADRLIEDFKKLTGTKNVLALVDYALPLPERRKLARKIKSELNDKVYAVIDRVLLLFLANNYNVQFINQILMNTMMPFSYYQPYVWDSCKVMPPELFMGRKEELEKIQSPTGVNLVYGGRQLGKSALLKMAKMNIDRDENNNRAILVEIKGLDYEKAAKKIGHELYDAGILDADIDTTDWEDLARAIKRRLQNTKLPYIPYLLLLLDEADTFIDSCESINYQPFDVLKEIQSVGMDRFKFVIAGLHNIVRFKRDAALSNNSVLTHLTWITVKPFAKREAKELLVKPLSYLGFRFPEEKQALVSLILANTNYFPGLIQLYCAKLVESMRKNDYGGYVEANTPEYEINETLIKKVLANADFMNQIREKFEITLKLDGDNMYYILALLIAYLYHQNTNSASESEGFSAKDIIEAGRGLFIKKIYQLSEERVNGLLQELLELNILRQTVTELYLFSRYSFFQMMGTQAEVENKLEAYMED